MKLAARSQCAKASVAALFPPNCPRRPLAALAAVLMAFQTGQTKAFAADDSPRLKFAPLFQIEVAMGKHQLVIKEPSSSSQTKQGRAMCAFFAVIGETWPEGLVPVFSVETVDRFELRRRPAKGQENSTAPLFFALPPQNEEGAAKIAGRWECVAKHADGSKKYLAFELAVEGEEIAGRFDQNTDYRVASIAGGIFRSNRIELKVEYIQDRYILTGDWKDGKLTGTWRHSDEADHGTWEATRPEPKPSVERRSEAVPLFEWRRARDGARRYSIQADLDEPGWEQVPKPLCRVWRN